MGLNRSHFIEEGDSRSFADIFIGGYEWDVINAKLEKLRLEGKEWIDFSLNHSEHKSSWKLLLENKKYFFMIGTDYIFDIVRTMVSLVERAAKKCLRY